MNLSMGLGLTDARRMGVGLIPPPYASSLHAYFEATLGTLDAGGAAADDYEKISTWRDQAGGAGTHHLVQSTVADQMQLRKLTKVPLVTGDFLGELSTVGMTNASVSINQRAATFVALMEADQLRVQSTAQTRIIMSLPGSVADLYTYVAGSNTAWAKLYWRDGVNGTVDTGISVRSSLSLVMVILDSGSIKIVYNDQTYTIASPLGAGTSTGFSILKGSIGTQLIGGFNCIAWYDHAFSAGEITATQAWAESRLAKASPTRFLIAGGASLGAGCFAEGNLNAFRQWANLNLPNLNYYNFSFAGNTLTNVRDAFSSHAGVNDVAVGTRLHNPNIPQLAWLLSTTGDIATGTTAATMISVATELRAKLRAYGYQVIWTGMLPIAGLTAPQEQKRIDFNAGMAALDSRQYGTYIPPPAEITDPLDPTYFVDTVHINKAGFDLIYRDAKATADSLIAVVPTSLQTWMKFNGDYTDSSGFQRDWEAVGSPSFISGLWGRQALRCTAGGNYARGKALYREFDVQYWSAMWWMRTSEAGNLNMWGKYTGAANTFLFSRHSGLTLRAFSNNIGTAISSSTYFNDGNWHCCAYSVDTDGIRLYASADQYPANLTLQSFVAGTPVVSVCNNRYRVGTADGATTHAIDFQDLMTWFGSKTLAEFQAIDVS